MTIVRTNITPLLKCTVEDGLEGIAEGLGDFSQALFDFNKEQDRQIKQI
jgi:hypothetical protein